MAATSATITPARSGHSPGMSLIALLLLGLQALLLLGVLAHLAKHHCGAGRADHLSHALSRATEGLSRLVVSWDLLELNLQFLRHDSCPTGRRGAREPPRIITRRRGAAYNGIPLIYELLLDL